jgi:hypothetical protein
MPRFRPAFAINGAFRPFALVLLAALGAAALAASPLRPSPQKPGPPKDYVLSFTHDGFATSAYVVTVDGAVTPVKELTGPVCSMVGDTRQCVGTLTLTTNVTHVVVVAAVNEFGEAPSDPYPTGPPKKPFGVSLK